MRPHELLNYFSFETDPIEKGDLFSVKGSAEQTEPGPPPPTRSRRITVIQKHQQWTERQCARGQ